MHKESFRILKEISSLYQKKLDLTAKIERERDRITSIQNQQSEREEEHDSCQQEHTKCEVLILSKEKDLDALQTTLLQNQSHLNSVFTEQEIQALENQIADGKKKIDTLENSLLNLIEEVETLETKIQDAKSFILGSSETIKEISLDITAINAPLIEELGITSRRMELLLAELPLELAELIKNLLKEQLKYGAFTRIEQDACFICRMELPKSEIEQVEKLLKIKQCGTCSRVFIPISSQYL